MKWMLVALVVAGSLTLLRAATFAAEPKAGSAEAFYNQAVKAAGSRGAGAGEQFCWDANYSMGTFVRAYETWHNTEWLDWGVKFYDFCISKMQAGPDGLKGWIGSYGYDGKVWCDVHVGDAILADNMLEFAELVLASDELKKKYGEAANRYVELARKHVIGKWDSRGTWREDGPYGAYVSWDTYCEPEKLDAWKKLPDTNGSGLSLPFNKQNDMAQVCLKLYRITGQKSHRDKAEKIFSFMRSRFQFVGDHYVWNYWEPFGPWDVDLAAGKTRHWMNVHGYRNYQAGEIGQIVEAYHTGLVFTRKDIERIVNTNLKVMWNQDKAAAKFVNSNADLPVPVMTEAEKKAQAEAEAANPYAKEGRAGCLWTGLLDFDPTIRELYAVQLKGDKTDVRSAVARDYFENVTMKRPPGFTRRWCREGEFPRPERPVSECRSLTVATVMPCVVKAGTKSVVLCKARVPVELEVAVYSADGKDKKLTLHKGPVPGGTDGLAGIFILQWDGSDPAGQVKLDRGDYRLRWTVPDGYREFAVTIQ